MTQKEINEGNKLIAEFMGFEYNRSIPGHGGEVIMTLGIEDCRYHASWDWLMPVVEKIVGIDDFYSRLFISKHGEEAANIVEKIREALCYVMLPAAWRKIIEFVEWYKSAYSPLKEATN